MLPHARVLVADDDPELLRAVAEALEREGAEVVRAETGAQLIERMADEGPFALVVTDISMPWMSGLQAMHSARFAGLGTPIVVMTALDDDHLSEQVQALGQNAILLRKPFGLTELESAAKKLLSAAPPSEEPASAAPSAEPSGPEEGEATAMPADHMWLRTVLDQLSEGVVLMDTSGRVTAKNQAAAVLAASEPRQHDRFGNAVMFDLRLPSGERLSPEQCPGVRAIVEEESVAVQELLACRGDGRLVPVLVSAAPARTATGKLVGATMILEDVSELKELERFREQWASLVAHDLRQPINTIVLTSDLALRSATTKEQRDQILRVRNSAKRLSRMVSDLSDALQIETHRLKLLRERLDLGALVHEVVERAPDVASRTKVHTPGDRRLFVSGDAGRLEQVLTTLLSSAMECGAPERDVRVELEGSGDRAEISVTNFASGIAIDDLSQLFERCDRAHALKLGVAKGSGLYITKGLVEAHGGTIWAERDGDDETVCHLTLPLDGPPIPASPAGAAGAAAARPG